MRRRPAEDPARPAYDRVQAHVERDRIGGVHAEVSWHEGAYLHFAVVPARPPERPVSTGVQVGFRVPDLEAVHQRAVAAGVKVLHPPRDEPWGRTARYLDPDGNVVGISGEVPAGYREAKRGG